MGDLVIQRYHNHNGKFLMKNDNKNDYLNIIGHILALAILWAVSGYAMGTAVEHIMVTLRVEYHYSIAVIFASINLIIGMFSLKHIISEPIGDKMFFHGPEGESDGDIRVGCLWVAPATFLLYGLLAWLVALLFRFLASR
jgi:hypothetical protein